MRAKKRKRVIGKVKASCRICFFVESIIKPILTLSTNPTSLACNVIKLYNQSCDRSNPIKTILYYNLFENCLFICHLLSNLANFFNPSSKSTFQIYFLNELI